MYERRAVPVLSKKGQVVLDLGPSTGNPRNSEGAFVKLNDGRTLFMYSRFVGDSYADDAPSCIAATYSGDGGRTWSGDEVAVRSEEHGALNVMSVSLLRMQNGDIGLFYLVRYGMHDMRLHLRRSADEGASWGNAHCCIPGPGYYVTNNDRVVRLSGGRLLIPAAYHKMIRETKEDLGSWDRRGIVYFFYSDDDGDTWMESRNFCSLNVPHIDSGLQEPGVVELSNGVLWAWARTSAGRQYEMFSRDKGKTWSPAVPSQFTSPNSPLSMKRVPECGHLLAVWNPVPNFLTRDTDPVFAGRTPLIGAVSKDEGESWQSHFAVETEEDKGGFCYTAIHFVQDAVLLAYCAGGPEDRNCTARLKIRRILLEDMQAG